MTFLQLFEYYSGNLPFQIKPDSERFEERLGLITLRVKNQLKGLRGGQRMRPLQKCRSVDINVEKIINASRIKRQNGNTQTRERIVNRTC